ncbi:hypothetical protein Ct61P_15407 [Colletotrichum tofieldiae]|nr:hypothetical protein Ct61P_15407 [Colletotrichum tofieldiae]
MTDFFSSESSSGRLLDPHATIGHQPWLRTDRVIASGAVIDVDPDMFSPPPRAPRLMEHAESLEDWAMADALRAAGAQ